MPLLVSRSSSRLSNGETESVKTMIVHDEGESDAGSTPCKDSTLIVRQVLTEEKTQHPSVFTTFALHTVYFFGCSVVYFVHSYPFQVFFPLCVDHFLLLSYVCGRWREGREVYTQYSRLGWKSMIYLLPH